MKIGIVEDNRIIAQQLIERLSTVTDIQILFHAENGLEALSQLETISERPDILLMDIEMPKMNGIETTFKVKSHYPDIKIIILTVFDQEEAIFKSIQAGATGYLLKDEKLPRLLQAFQDVTEGGAPMSPMVAQKTLAMMLNNSQEKSIKTVKNSDNTILTKRELEILEFLSKGFKNQAIADTLFVSLSTVKKHIENIYSKLHLNSRVELVNWYRNT